MRASCKSKRCRKFVTVSGIDRNLLFKNHKNSLKMEISTKNFIKNDLFLNFFSNNDCIFWHFGVHRGFKVKVRGRTSVIDWTSDLSSFKGSTLKKFWKTALRIQRPHLTVLLENSSRPNVTYHKWFQSKKSKWMSFPERPFTWDAPELKKNWMKFCNGWVFQ